MPFVHVTRWAAAGNRAAYRRRNRRSGALLAAALLFVGCSTTLARDNTAPRDTAAVHSASTTMEGDTALSTSTSRSGAERPAGEADGGSLGLATKLPPLTYPQEIAEIDVVGFRPAAVALPIGATGKRPIVVALHGNFDRPEWQCEVWHRITRDRAFVLCPRGIPRGDAPRALDRWTYGRTAAVRSEIDAALTALRAHFASHLDEGPLLYIGFSLGAILGAGIVAEDAARFPRAVLIEGGHSAWSDARVQAFAAGGGKRLLFACGQRGCMNDAAKPEKLLSRAGVDVRRVFGGEVGHTYDGAVAAEIERAWTWLIADDPRFSR